MQGMFRRGTEVYRDQPYEQNVEFYQDAYYTDWGRDRDSIAKGVLIGAAAGLFAGWAMVQFQKLWAFSQEELSGRQTESETPKHRQAAQQEQRQQEDSDDATQKLANKISQATLDRDLTQREKDVAGPAIHYGFAALAGAIYGGLAEVTDVTTSGFGALFGTLLFLGADEVVVPALKLSPPPGKVSADKHLYGWVSHLVYAASLEGARRGLQRAAG
jgi:putative membrane protein